MTDPTSSGPQRTVFRPSPLQNLTGAAPTPAAGAPPPAAPVPPPRSNDDVPPPPIVAERRNLMMAEATGLLALIASVRAGRARIDLPSLHRQVAAAISAFEQAVAGRYSDEELRRAKYALAATADDVALNLPDQAEAAEWARRSMVVRFFSENIGGDRFWRLLDEMIARPAEYRDLLELYHACMAAGFEGRYRVVADGKREHTAKMQSVFQALEHPKSMSMNELSPHWRGQPTPPPKLGFWTPLAFAAAAAAALLLIVFIILRLVLAQTGQPVIAALNGINPDQPLRLSRVAPPPPTPPEGEQLTKLKTFLAPEIAQNLVVVLEDSSTVRVRTTVGQLFKSGSDQLDPGRESLIDRIGQGIEDEPGPVSVEGYTDSDQVHSISFPDNMALSKARAETAAGIIRKHLSDPSRVTAEGYGDAQPIAPNSTAEGKAQNRRVEFVIQRKG